MRVGSNPIKDNYDIIIDNYHRIVVPVYIPNFEGYFAESFEVLKLCIDSLLLTIHDKSRITIYNNDSHADVKKYIDDKYSNEPLIDQVFHSKENLGKVNAILAAVKGNLEPLITITDSDVLFKNDWQYAVEKTFIDFPEAGMVSPVPLSKLYRSSANNNWYFGFFKGKLQFEKVRNSDAMYKFDVSLGNKELNYSQVHLNNYLVLTSGENKAKAVMGCGHFVATLKREVFDKGSDSPAFIKIVGGVETKYIDTPNENLGMLRLATLDNYAFHMGNNTEKWMYEEFDNLKKYPLPQANYKSIDFRFFPISNFGKAFGKLINSLLNRNIFKVFILRKLGLKKEEALQY